CQTLDGGHMWAKRAGKQVLRDGLVDETQTDIPQHRCDPTATEEHGHPFPMPLSTIPGPQPQHTGKERQVHSATLQREQLQRRTPGKGRGHAPQHNPQSYPYPEEAHEAVPADLLTAHHTHHEHCHKEAGAAREEPPRPWRQTWGTDPERAPPAD